MKPSRLVTSGGVRRDTARGMRKSTKAALVSGAAAAAIAATVGVAAPANAYPAYGAPNAVTFYTYWGGTDCISIEGAQLYNQRATSFHTGCGGGWTWNEVAGPGEIFGGDPIMGSASWASCKVYVNGDLVYSDYATAGDGTDVNCLRTY